MNDLKTRGVQDILIAVVDGLKGFPEAIGAAFPETIVQTCIVHLIRSSLAFVSWKDRKVIMPELKAIYRAETAEAAVDRLGEFKAKWGARYPAISQSWRRAWERRDRGPTCGRGALQSYFTLFFRDDAPDRCVLHSAPVHHPRFLHGESLADDVRTSESTWSHGART